MKNYILQQEGMPRTGRILVSDDGNRRELDLAKSLKLWNHSPTGFTWGYAGSGPAQSALGILLDHIGDGERAIRLHQRFKFDKIATLPPEGGSISGQEIDDWLANIETGKQLQPEDPI